MRGEDPVRAAPFAVVATHVSWLLFTPTRVYKVKRPVRFGFLDHSTVAARRRSCLAEVTLNSRLAPDVYEGVGTFEDPNGASEPVVVMRRLPAGRRLSAVAGAGSDPGDCIDRIASMLARFHERYRGGPDAQARCTAAAQSGLWERNMAELIALADGIVDLYELEASSVMAREYLAGRGDLLAARIGAGRAVDGHGDLLCDDVFCLDEGPRILDCLEFDRELRSSDALSDLAALAMDLERLERPDLARRLLDSYRRGSGDDWPASLADLFIAYRALVRCKIACIRARSAASPSAAEADATEARQLSRLAAEHLQHGAVRLVLVGGLPGSGKTTVAGRLSELTGWPVVSSDLIRKRMAGLAPGESGRATFGAGIYSADATAAVYATLLQKAATLLREGRSVILDASWTRGCWRRAATETASNHSARYIPILCHTTDETAAARLVTRELHASGPSDATASIRFAMATATEPWEEAYRLDTSGDPGEAACAALQLMRYPRQMITSNPEGIDDL